MSESAHDDRRDAGATELAAFQAALARLQPAPDGINIARLLFHAGQLSAPRRSWVWPCMTAVSMMLAVTLGAMLLLRPVPQPAERIVTVYVSSPSAPKVGQVSNLPKPSRLETCPTPNISTEAEPSTDGGDYLQLRREVLARGLDALPPPAPWPAAAPPIDADTLFDIPHDGRDPWFLRLKRSLKSGDAL